MQEISERIGVSTKTIQREVKRGSVELLNSDLTVKKEYVAEFAHQKYRDKQKAKEGIYQEDRKIYKRISKETIWWKVC